MSSVPDILKKILQTKQSEISVRQREVPMSQLKETIAYAEDQPRGFISQLKSKTVAGQPAVIAEIKKSSPSQGVIREDFDPATIAQAYARSGAACLSVLTDKDYFQGHETYLKAARAACDLPVIRKDFIIAPYQVYEARAIGADCILLIVSALDDAQLNQLYTLATSLAMDVLIEAHDKAELLRALAVDASMVGINNRNLRTFETRLQTTLDLLPLIPDECLVVTESGIHNKQDVQRMRDNQVNAFLVGEAFMRADCPGEALNELFFA